MQFLFHSMFVMTEIFFDFWLNSIFNIFFWWNWLFILFFVIDGVLSHFSSFVFNHIFHYIHSIQYVYLYSFLFNSFIDNIFIDNILFISCLCVYFLLHKKEMNLKMTNGVCSSILFLCAEDVSFFRFFSLFSSFSWWCWTRCSFMEFCVLKNIPFSQDWKNIIGRVSNSIEQCRMD